MSQVGIIHTKNKDSRKIPIEEVAKHRTADDFWVAVDGSVYDLTDFVDKHPGGSLILSGGGTDATVLYNCYHFQNKKKSDAVLAKYKIGEFDGQCSQMGEFWKEVSARVAHEMKNVEKRPLRGKVLFIADLVGSVLLLGLSLTLSPSTNPLLIAAVWFVYFCVFLNRLQQQQHALGHFQLFDPNTTAWLDPLLVCLSVLSSAAMSLSTKGNVREKAHLGREEAQKELPMRGPYEHQALHHVMGASLEHDGCYQLVTRSGLLRLRGTDPVAFYHQFQESIIYQRLATCCTIFTAYLFGPVLSRIALFSTYIRNGDYYYAACSVIGFMSGLISTRFFLLLPTSGPLGVILFIFGLITASYHSSSQGVLFFAQHVWDKVIDETLANQDWGRYNAESCYSLWPVESMWARSPVLWFQFGTCPATLTYHLEHTLFPGINYLHLKRVAPIVKKCCEEFQIRYNVMYTMEELHTARQQMLIRHAVKPKAA